MISASVTNRSGPFSRATNCTCIVLLLAIASSSAPSWNGRGAFGLAVRECPENDFLRPPPGSQRPPGGGEGTQGRGPKAHLTSVATTGPRRRAGVPAGAQRREPRRGWRARAATRLLRSLDNRSLEGAAARPEVLAGSEVVSLLRDWQTQGDPKSCTGPRTSQPR